MVYLKPTSSCYSWRQTSNWLVFKLASNTLGQYNFLPAKAGTVKINEEGIPSTISSDRASLAAQHSAADLPGATATASWWTASVVTWTTNKVQRKSFCNYAKGAKKCTKVDSRYKIDHIVGHVSEGRNTRYVIKWYVYTAVNDPIKQLSDAQWHSSSRYLQNWLKENA